MKRLLSTILSATLLITSSAVCAESEYSVSVKTDYSADITTVDGDFGTDYSYRRANIVVLNPGFDSSDLGKDASAVNWSTQQTLDADGKFSVSMSLVPSESSEDTVYTVLVAVDRSGEVIERTFEMYNEIYVESVVKSIKDAVSANDSDAVGDIIRDCIVILDIASTDEYIAFETFTASKKERVYDGIINESPDSVETFVKSFALAVNAVSLDDITEPEVYKEAIIGFTDEAADSVRTQLEESEADSELIKALMKEKFNSKTDIVNKLYELTVLKEINSSKIWTELASVYLKYADALGIDTTAYEKLSGKKTAVTALLGENFKTVKEAARAFDDAVEIQAEKDNDNSSSGSSSGGGGGGGKGKGSVSIGGASASPVVPVVPETPTDNPVSFNDLAGFEWASDAINTLSEKKIINGYADNVFAPGKNITRAEFVKLFVSSLGIAEAEGDMNFADVNADDWHYDFIRSAYCAGLINGVASAEFAPDSFITRQDIAVILNRYLKLSADSSVTFADEARIADYAADAVKALSAKKIINGYEDNTFRPEANASRAEVAVIISRILEMKEGI